jgi:hypothetical protein
MWRHWVILYDWSTAPHRTGENTTNCSMATRYRVLIMNLYRRMLFHGLTLVDVMTFRLDGPSTVTFTLFAAIQNYATLRRNNNLGPWNGRAAIISPDNRSDPNISNGRDIAGCHKFAGRCVNDRFNDLVSTDTSRHILWYHSTSVRLLEIIEWRIDDKKYSQLNGRCQTPNWEGCRGSVIY